jgi:hypothetical protein
MSCQPDRHPEPRRDRRRPSEHAAPGGPDPPDDHASALLDELLDAAAAEPEPVPPGLIDDVEAFIIERCRRRRAWLGAACAAAATVLILVTCWLAARMPWGPPTGPARPGSPVVRAGPPPAPAVSVDAGPGVIAVPIRTGDPKVTIVWLYPAIDPREHQVRRP